MFVTYVSVLVLRAIGAGPAGAAAVGPKFGQKASGVYGRAFNYARVSSANSISTQNCTRNDLRWSKMQNFSGGRMPPDPPSGNASCA